MVNSMSKNSVEKLKLTTSMGIFGSIGIFVRYIPLPSSILALARGGIGVLFLLLLMIATGQKLSFQAIKRNRIILLLSGTAIGVNWILLFEAYHFTTVATATLCYYLAPALVIIFSPLVLREKLTVKRLLCVVVALGGMVFVSGVLETDTPDITELKGIFLGLGAAFFYAAVILLNKKLHDISAYDKTVMQLGVSTLVLLPYTFLTQSLDLASISWQVILLLVLVGVVHTGGAYALYFDSMKALNAQTVAIFSYIDPLVAILLSAIILQEGLGVTGIIGAAMILGATFVSELTSREM